MKETTVPLVMVLVLAGCETIPYRSHTQPDERPLVVVGRITRAEWLPLPSRPPATCSSDSCEIVIRLWGPQLVHVAVREVVFGDFQERELTFPYWSHLGIGRTPSDALLTLAPVEAEGWDWEMFSDGKEPLLATRDGQLAVPVWSNEQWSSLPCAVRSRVGPVELVDKELPVPRTGILLADVREGLRRLYPTQREMGCRPGEHERGPDD